MSTGRIFVTFCPGYGKNMSHLSRNLMEIETIIHEAHGSDFTVDPHNATAFLFHLPPGVSECEADRIVQRLGTLADDDGQLLLEVEQGICGHVTQTRLHGLSRSA